jgi:hypothetical protein
MSMLAFVMAAVCYFFLKLPDARRLITATLVGYAGLLFFGGGGLFLLGFPCSLTVASSSMTEGSSKRRPSIPMSRLGKRSRRSSSQGWLASAS